MKISRFYFALPIALIILFSCNNQETILPSETLNLPVDAPNYSEESNMPFLNGVNRQSMRDVNQVIHLGRVLFYDKALSAGGTVSCGSCHHQQFAFADPFKHSVGIGTQLSERNTPSIINTAFGSGLFWDQRAETLTDLVTRPIANHREMGFSNMEALIDKLNSKSYYQPLVNEAFGTDQLSENQLQSALAMFCGQLNSFDSDVDLQGFGEVQLTNLQTRGMQLFEQKQCNNCHGVLSNGNLLQNASLDFNGEFGSIGYSGAVQSGDVANIGLNQVYSDNGVGALTGNSADDGKFKIPTLRNVSVTAPYMHDGRFASLNDVLDFYSSGIKPHKNLDFRLSDGAGHVLPIEMDASEKEAIIAFLHGLTSKDILTNPMFSNPFQ